MKQFQKTMVFKKCEIKIIGNGLLKTITYYFYKNYYFSIDSNTGLLQYNIKNEKILLINSTVVPGVISNKIKQTNNINILVMDKIGLVIVRIREFFIKS